jgi:hypothetical protein
MCDEICNRQEQFEASFPVEEVAASGCGTCMASRCQFPCRGGYQGFGTAELVNANVSVDEVAVNVVVPTELANANVPVEEVAGV